MTISFAIFFLKKKKKEKACQLRQIQNGEHFSFIALFLIVIFSSLMPFQNGKISTFPSIILNLPRLILPW